MSLIRNQSYTIFDRFHQEFFGPSLRDENSDTPLRLWHPAVDVREEEDKYVIHADLPGVEAGEIDITVENGVLTLKGKRTGEKADERDGYQRVERVQGTFMRRFSLPETADADRVVAKSKDGVLEIVLPKHAKMQPRRIAVTN
jgi:HSP20 family protein